MVLKGPRFRVSSLQVSTACHENRRVCPLACTYTEETRSSELSCLRFPRSLQRRRACVHGPRISYFIDCRQWREIVQEHCWRLKAERDFPKAHKLLVAAIPRKEALQQDGYLAWMNLVKHLTVVKVDHFESILDEFSDPDEAPANLDDSLRFSLHFPSRARSVSFRSDAHACLLQTCAAAQHASEARRLGRHLGRRQTLIGLMRRGLAWPAASRPNACAASCLTQYCASFPRHFIAFMNRLAPKPWHHKGWGSEKGRKRRMARGADWALPWALREAPRCIDCSL